MATIEERAETAERKARALKALVFEKKFRDNLRKGYEQPAFVAWVEAANAMGWLRVTDEGTVVDFQADKPEQ